MRLELKLSAQLDHPLRDIGAEPRPENARRRLLLVDDLAKGLICHPIVGIPKIGMVEKIEELRADRQHGVFSNLCIFHDREVSVEITRPRNRLRPCAKETAGPLHGPDELGNFPALNPVSHSDCTKSAPDAGEPFACTCGGWHGIADLGIAARSPQGPERPIAATGTE